MSASTLSERDRSFLARLSEIDFGPIAFKLMHPEEGEGWSLEQVTRAVEHYRRFLFLNHCYPERAIVPSREIDQVWHTHILDTAKYREDCDRLFGQFMDHWPYFGMRSAEERAQLNTAFEETQALYAKHFGAPAAAQA
ncbi:MAG: glycine-rich domain-containing protein-like [Leptolyngbya sp. SIO4C1]|nr:glycine-rich domain-containing protein-like [Leptolyngbya sp. SIO4C1]